jgi:hypothetical protein
VPESGAVPAPPVPSEVQAWLAIPEQIRPMAPDYPVRTKDKVAIVGFADGHRDLAPFDNPEFEIWGLNRLHAAMAGKRWDRWFEIHSIPHEYLGGNGQPPDKDHLEFLRTFPGPVYIRPQDVGTIQCPSAAPYALNAVLRDFSLPADRPYFTNSISYEIVYAVAMGFKEIHLYGVDMAQDGVLVQTAEYRAQRPSCEYFLGIASGRGIRIVLPPGSDLLISDHLYGFEDGSPMFRKRTARLAELNRRKDGVRAKLAELDAQKAAMEAQYWAHKINLVSAINQMDGAAQEVVYEMNQLSSPIST